MSRILAVSDETAEGFPAAAMENARQTRGYVSGTLRLLLVDPKVAQAGQQLYEHLNLRPDSPLSRLQREMLATVVSGMLSAKPCLSLHCEALRRLTGDADLGPEFAFRWPDYPVDARTRALLRYGKQLTESPDTTTDADLEALRRAGWDDRGIYEATALIGFFNFAGRLEAASGLPMDEIPAVVDLAEARPDGRSDSRPVMQGGN
jgi:uncharacterized peroxidase-related enzyme